MNAIPFTALRWRLAQSKPTRVTRLRTSRASRRASRKRRCSTKRYELGPLSGSLSESPIPIRSGAMQRPSGCRYGNTLRQRYDEVGLPCSSTMGSPVPTSTYAISRPRTCRRCFWYGNAAEIMLGPPFLFVVHRLEGKREPDEGRPARGVCGGDKVLWLWRTAWRGGRESVRPD